MTRKESTINIERIEAAKDVATLRELLLSLNVLHNRPWKK